MRPYWLGTVTDQVDPSETAGPMRRATTQANSTARVTYTSSETPGWATGQHNAASGTRAKRSHAAGDPIEGCGLESAATPAVRLYFENAGNQRVKPYDKMR